MTRGRPIRGVQEVAGASEGRQQEINFGGGQAGESQTPARVAPEFCVGDHKAILLLFRIRSKDYEQTPEASEAMIRIAAIHHLLQRLRPKGKPYSQRFRL